MPAVRVKYLRVILLAAAAVCALFQLGLISVDLHGDGRLTTAPSDNDWQWSLLSHFRHSSANTTNAADSTTLPPPPQLCMLGTASTRDEVEEWMAEWSDVPAMWTILIAPSDHSQQTSETVDVLSSSLAIRHTRTPSADGGLCAAGQHFSSHYTDVQCDYFFLGDATVRLESVSAESSGRTASRDTLLNLLRQHNPAVVTFPQPPNDCPTTIDTTTATDGGQHTTVHPPLVVHRSLMEFVFPVVWTTGWQFVGRAAAISLLPSMYPLTTLATSAVYRTVHTAADCSKAAAVNNPTLATNSPLTSASYLLYASKALHNSLPTSSTTAHPHRPTDYLALLNDGYDILHPSIVDIAWVSAHHTLDSLRTFRATGCNPRLTLLVFTLNRLTSLHRLLQSMLTSDYTGWQTVAVHVHVDYSDVQSTVRHYLDNFTWPYGTLDRSYANLTMGLRDSLLSAWQPHSLDEFAVFLEDDIEVSPQFAVWVRVAVLHYYYSTDRPLRQSPLMGVSLYMPVWSERVDQPFWVDTTFPVYGMQAPSSWGAVYFPYQWTNFRHWQQLHSHIDPLVPGLAGINSWSSSRSWKKYLIRYMVEQGYFMLYPNRMDGLSFSTNHAEAGTNVYFSAEWKAVLDARFNVPLVPADDRDRWYQRHSAVLIDTMRVIDIFDQPVKLTEQQRIPVIPVTVWQAYSQLTIAISLATASPASHAAVVASLHYWQHLSVLHELVVQLPAHINFTCPILRVRCTVNRANVTTVDSYLWPFPLPHAAAVLLLSPHIRLPLIDVADMFYVWQRHPDQVVGIANLTRSYRVEQGEYVEWSEPLPQFTLLPGGAVLLAAHYLALYWCDERPYHTAVRHSVWQRGRGEEVALLRLISNVTSRWPAVLDRAVGGSVNELWHEPTELYAADLDVVQQGYGEQWPWLNGRTLHITDTVWPGIYELPDSVIAEAVEV